MMKNEKIILVNRPKGTPQKSDFHYEEASIPELKNDQVLLKTIYLSVDPYMRGRMSDRKSYVPPFALNEPISGGVVGQVVESRSGELAEGDFVIGNLNWQTYNVASDAEVRKLDPSIAPLTANLGVLGMTGLTAYFGLLDIGDPQEGETVVVSGAAGAVGTIVGQIAKIKGARVVGIAGSDEKISYLKDELGFDAAINYKTENVYESLKAACPNGVDVYFDNVGGEISDSVIALINKGARIPVCGQIALYNLEKADVGPRMQSQLLINSALMKGFIVSDYAAHFEEGAIELAKWLKEGKLSYSENIVDGFENTIDAFLGLFSGENTGKQLVKVAEPESV
ncbi:NADP-dependent oxidoreductase [Fictibacillus phosphorivorans]|uniref:NADP-dependent oxidoreductase n=1 Tax=Fictibacillus phosphorivorans TaxID=1221500 RepID=A0A168CQ57_9BACL|nr:NADP-dependent oxidoreductase [Fictibacillus phosphorivorans]KZE63858.1 NADP-dependent oxidoreductase [Fictibacillus phosphorivorans]